MSGADLKAEIKVLNEALKLSEARRLEARQGQLAVEECLQQERAYWRMLESSLESLCDRCRDLLQRRLASRQPAPDGTPQP